VIAQFLGGVWALTTVSLADGFDLERGIRIITIGNLGLSLGYFFGPGRVSSALGRGPGVDFDIAVGLREAWVAIGLGVILQLAVLPVLYWPIGWFTDTDPGESARELIDLVNGPLDVVFLALAVVLIAPVVEERYFRGLLLPAMAKSTGLFVGILGSSFIFALVHQQLILIPGLMLLAVVLSWMTASTGRIGPAVVTHMAFNATTVVKLLLDG
jgi:membrane protease YdiL (CAAX protease family)